MTTHRERIQACLAGEIPDQTPAALWRHFPVDDQNRDEDEKHKMEFAKERQARQLSERK